MNRAVSPESLRDRRLCVSCARRESALFRPEHVPIDSRRAQRCMPERALDEMRRDIRLKRIHAEPVPEGLRHGRCAGDAGRRHHGLDVSPGRRAAPAPKPQSRKLRISLRDPQLEQAIKLIDHVRRQGHLPDNPALPALEGLNARYTALDVNRAGGEGEHRDARAAPSQRQAEQTYLRGHASCRLDKCRRSAALRYFRLPD